MADVVAAEPGRADGLRRAARAEAQRQRRRRTFELQRTARSCSTWRHLDSLRGPTVRRLRRSRRLALRHSPAQKVSHGLPAPARTRAVVPPPKMPAVTNPRIAAPIRMNSPIGWVGSRTPNCSSASARAEAAEAAEDGARSTLRAAAAAAGGHEDREQPDEGEEDPAAAEHREQRVHVIDDDLDLAAARSRRRCRCRRRRSACPGSRRSRRCTPSTAPAVSPSSDVPLAIGSLDAQGVGARPTRPSSGRAPCPDPPRDVVALEVPLGVRREIGAAAGGVALARAAAGDRGGRRWPGSASSSATGDRDHREPPANEALDIATLLPPYPLAAL